MLIYENAWPSTYEEFKTWYPVWYRDILEMDAIWQVLGGQMDKVQALLVWMVDSNFIDHADASMIARLENFLGIVHPYPRTLVERRAVLRGFTIGRGHMGRPRIIELISIFTAGEIDVSFTRPGRINVAVTRDFGDMFNLHDINMIIGHRIPSHLSLWIADFPRPVRAVNSNSFIFIGLLIRFCIANMTAPGFRLYGSRQLCGSWLLGGGMMHGISFADFHVQTAVRNHGAIAEGITLGDGFLLDGTIFLNGKKFAPVRGMAAQGLDIGVLRVEHAGNVEVIFAARFGIRNITRLFPLLDGENKLDGTWELDPGTHGIRNIDFQAQAKISNTVSVHQGARLDGKRLLDGGWNLNEWGGLIHGAAAKLFAAGPYTFQTGNRLSGTLAKTGPWALDGELLLDAGLSIGGTQLLGELILFGL